MDPSTEARAYLDRLPHGTASYPECTVRASIYEPWRNALPPFDLRTTSEVFSPAFATYLRSGPSDDWIPEVWASVLLELWFVHVCERDEGRCRARLRRGNREVFDGPLYRAVVRVFSPSLVIMGMARTWNLTRRGSGAKATMGPRSASPRTGEVVLSHPPWLFSERQLVGFEEGFMAVGDILQVPDPRVRRPSAGEVETSFRLEWTPR
jgi:hypothetical protein